MTGFVVKGDFISGVPMAEIDIITEIVPPSGQEPMIYPFCGIIDTGCPVCIVNPGVFLPERSST